MPAYASLYLSWYVAVKTPYPALPPPNLPLHHNPPKAKPWKERVHAPTHAYQNHDNIIRIGQL